MNMVATLRAHTQSPNWRLYAPPAALFLWACLWLNLNTGFWNIQAPHSLDEWQLLGRAILPFAVLPVAGLLILNRRKLNLPSFSPSQLLMIYGLLAAIAAIVSPQPIWSLYWSLTFLATIAAARTFATARSPVPSARQMLQVTWVVMAVVAAIIAYIRQPTAEMPPYTAKVISDAEIADIYAFLNTIPDPPKIDTIPLLK